MKVAVLCVVMIFFPDFNVSKSAEVVHEHILVRDSSEGYKADGIVNGDNEVYFLYFDNEIILYVADKPIKCEDKKGE